MTSRAPLNLRQQQFVAVLVADPKRNATAAYERVYEARGRIATSAAHRLMQDPRVLAEIDAASAASLKRLHLTADQVLAHIAELATADPRELSEHRRGACRHCWGLGHLYQRTPQQYRDALWRYRSTKEGKEDPAGLFFDHEGGVGFDRRREPHPECPECNGEGVEYSFFKDVRKLSPAAARLYAGVKHTKDGIKIETRSQDKAIELAAKCLGLMRDKDANENSEIPPAGNVVFAVEDASADAQA